jgi:uncharacterized protein (TIGR02145 family)
MISPVRDGAGRKDAMLRPVMVGILAVVLDLACGLSIPTPPPAPPPLGSATDVDGNTYATVVIGKQEWMASNLKVTKYNDGTPIHITEDASTWAKLSTPSYSWYDDDIANKDIYGALYNWWVIQYLQAGLGGGDICPTNFGLPSRGVWEALVKELGGSTVANGALKEAGTSHWDPPNTGATNRSGFTALPSGYRDDTGAFAYKGQNASWWTSEDDDLPGDGIGFYFNVDDTSTIYSAIIAGRPWADGHAIRCMRDVNPN